MKFRKALRADVPVVMQLIADDRLGQQREDLRHPLPEKYYDAFAIINADPQQELVVAEDAAGQVVGTLQLTFIQGLSHQGALRAQVEAVRVRTDQRGKGIGKQLLTWAIERAKQRHAHIVQLASHKSRTDAIRFYEALGFRATHEGMKLPLHALTTM